MNNKLTATLILLLILTQGFINYRLVQTSRALAGLAYLIMQPDQGVALVNQYLTTQKKKQNTDLDLTQYTHNYEVVPVGGTTVSK
jgi:hypothetical protein